MRNDAHFLVEGAHRRGVGYNGNKVKPKARHAEIPRQGGEKRLHVNIKKKIYKGLRNLIPTLSWGLTSQLLGPALSP